MSKKSNGRKVDWDAYRHTQEKIMHETSYISVEAHEHALNSILSGRTRSSSGEQLADNVSGSGRKQALLREYNRVGLNEGVTQQLDPGETLALHSQADVVAQAVTLVPLRPCLVLARLFDGVSTGEVGADLGISNRQVRNLAKSVADTLTRSPAVEEAVEDLMSDLPLLVATLHPALHTRSQQAA